ncbi:hypothetical protein ACIU1J_19420 [Azospirillum doebereinerae]|uniref:hypothetical protein n=1 Tax=Azospirillum doebereinerae TaxID=92933 RepID=UPI001EE5F59F|nr:hypothetical protein [Azospirillum doebereinerae]MCG5242294.1 hypothetical protein [Azospirillum doebereinerae]
MSLLPTTKPVAEAPLVTAVSDWRPASFRNARLRERDAGPPELLIELEDCSLRPASADELRGYLQENAEEFLSAYHNLSIPGAATLDHAPPCVVAMGSSWVGYWQNEREWGMRRFIEELCEGLAPLDPHTQRKCLNDIAAKAREIVGDERAERRVVEDGPSLPTSLVTLDWALDCASGLILQSESSKQALGVAIRMLQVARQRWEEPEREVANTNAMLCAVPIVTGLLHLAEHPDFTVPTRAPMAPVPSFGLNDELSPSLVDAYLGWRRMKVIDDWSDNVYGGLPGDNEEDALGDFLSAIASVERKLRDAVLTHPAPTVADKLLKLRCRLEYDEEAFRDAGDFAVPDLTHLTGLVSVPEPEVVEHPETDADRRDFLTAKPDAILLQPPADLLRLFTPEEGGEVFALAAAYRAAREDASSGLLPTVLQSLAVYGSYVVEHDGYKRVDPAHVPGLVLTQEERDGLGRLGHLDEAAIVRLDLATADRWIESEERQKQAKAKAEEKRVAAERAKHGPPTSERLIPLLPSFSEAARETASSLLHGASIAVTVHEMIAKHAATLQTQELEALRTLDLGALQERFQNEAQDVLRQEIDRALHSRQTAAVAS